MNSLKVNTVSLSDQEIYLRASVQLTEYEMVLEVIRLAKEAERARCAAIIASHTAEDEQGWLDLLNYTATETDGQSTDTVN